MYRERVRERERERLRMNESKRRGFLEGTSMEQSMNFFFFFFFFSVLASGLVQRAGLGNEKKKKKKKCCRKGTKKEKKWKRNSIFLSNYQKFIVLGLLFNRFLVYFSPWCPFFNYILLKFKT